MNADTKPRQVSISRLNPVYDADNNISGTLNLLEAARRSDIERFIYISSEAVYGDPITLAVNEEHPTCPLSPYGLSKLTGERYAGLYYSLYGLAKKMMLVQSQTYRQQYGFNSIFLLPVHLGQVEAGWPAAEAS